MRVSAGLDCTVTLLWASECSDEMDGEITLWKKEFGVFRLHILFNSIVNASLFTNYGLKLTAVKETRGKMIK